MLEKGKIVKNISNLYVVETPLGNFDCTPRGLFRYEKIVPLVGDDVLVNTENKSIEKILDRVCYLQRPAIANIEYALIVTSFKEPDYDAVLLNKLLVRFLSKKITPIIVFSKLDLMDKKDKKRYKEIKKYYKGIGIDVYTNKNIHSLKRLLNNKIAFLVGQTGAGKSTLINKLDNKLDLKTSPISKALGRGVHTTRHTELHKISNFYLADTPGFSALDLNDIKKEELKNYFTEFSNYNCKFNDCVHMKGECEVLKNIHCSKMLEERYKSYRKIYGEIDESSSKLYK